MALNPPSPTRSYFKNTSSTIASAASYLSAVSQADARARSHHDPSSPTSSPAPSLSVLSTGTGSSEDEEREPEDTDYDTLMHSREPSNHVFTAVHSEFGHCANESYRFTSKHDYSVPLKSQFSDPPYYILLSVYLTFLLLISIGHLRDFFGKRFRPFFYRHLMAHNVSQ